MTDKQELFVEEYLKDLNATQASIRAGYSAKTARFQGSRLLTNVNILEKISDIKKKLLDDIRADAYENILNLKSCATFNIKKLFKNGRLLNIDELDDETAIAIQSVTVKQKKRYDPDEDKDVWDDVIKVTVTDKLGSIELLGKYQGIFNNKIDVPFPNYFPAVRDGGPTDMTIYYPKKVPIGTPIEEADEETEVTVKD
ncbi:terminase small subunit [Candidatus Latescibacterota bacterium]